jgi:hypothetical protein
MPFEKGQSGNPDGRKKGSQNKFTSLKDAFLDAFEQLGGSKALIDWAKKSERNKGAFFQMITKMLPTNMTGDVKAKIIVELNKKLSDDRPEE